MFSGVHITEINLKGPCSQEHGGGSGECVIQEEGDGEEIRTSGMWWVASRAISVSQNIIFITPYP